MLKFFLIICSTTLCFGCPCSSTIKSSNKQVKSDISSFLKPVNQNLDLLSKQLSASLKILDNRTNDMNATYMKKLTKILQPLTNKKIMKSSITGQLMNTELYPPTSESTLLNHFLFEYKKLVELNYNKEDGYK